MSKFIIQGGNTLKGNIKVAGFKNAATPILAASVLTREEIILHNVPVIEDVKKMINVYEHDIDIYCSNVGIGAYEDFLKLTNEQWKNMIEFFP